MIKKLLILMILCISMISIGFSVTTLNSCGKNSGWVDGETYIVNFTSTDLTQSFYSNSAEVTTRGLYCFLIDSATHDIRFLGNNNPIEFNVISPITGTSESSFIKVIGATQNNLTIENLNVHVNTDSFETYTTGLAQNVNFLGNGITGVGLGYDEYLKFKNVTLLSFYNILRNYNSAFGYTRMDAYDSYFHSTSSFQAFNYVSASHTFKVYDSLFIGQRLDSGLRGYYVSQDSIFVLQDDNLTGSYNTGSITNNSMVKGIIGIDADNNNIFDTNPTSLPMHYNSVISKEMFGYKFLQDLREGEYFQSSSVPNININDETIGSPNIAVVNGTLDTSLSVLNFTQIAGLELIQGGILNCKIINDDYCLIQDTNNIVLSSSDYKGVIRLSGYNNISRVNFYNGDLNNLNIISNSGTSTITDVTINDIILTTEWALEDIKLKVNNLKMYDNIFTASSGTGSTANFSFLNIESLSPQSNKIYNNIFEDSVISDENGIFVDNCDAQFYSNYLESGVVLSNECVGLNATPRIAYTHTDGKVYYFYVGNYYEDNVGCVDLNGDNFCDSPYTSGSVTDTHPLVSYPFDYTLSLPYADEVIDNLEFNISLISPLDNQVITITGLSDVIDFGFSQNSDFTDLSCDYIINALFVSQETSVEKNVDYVISINGFPEQNYTYRVECYNGVAFEQSEEISFSVEYSAVISGCTNPIADNYNPLATIDDGSCEIGGQIIGCLDSTATNYNPLATLSDGSCVYESVGNFGGDLGLFTSDYESDGNAFISILGLGSRGLGSLLIIGFALLFVSMIAVIFGVMWALIGGKK